jgi:hypothetical protein
MIVCGNNFGQTESITETTTSPIHALLTNVHVLTNPTFALLSQMPKVVGDSLNWSEGKQESFLLG